MTNEITPEELERMEAGIDLAYGNCDHENVFIEDEPCASCICGDGNESHYEDNTTRLIAAYRDALGRIAELESRRQRERP